MVFGRKLSVGTSFLSFFCCGGPVRFTRRDAMASRGATDPLARREKANLLGGGKRLTTYVLRLVPLLHLPSDWRADARTTTAHANGSTLPGSALMHLPGAPLTPRRHLSASSGCHRPEKLGSRSEELLATELLAPTSGRTAVRRCVCVQNASYPDPGGYAAGAVVATAPRRVRHLSDSP